RASHSINKCSCRGAKVGYLISSSSPGKAIESRQPSSEDRRQPPLARATERIVVRQTLVELRERTVLALQQNPFDVDELRVPPHANAHLSLEIELVLRCHRQALERIECAL